jgi:selenocysteine lyase/cysteine desulfurase
LRRYSNNSALPFGLGIGVPLLNAYYSIIYAEVYSPYGTGFFWAKSEHLDRVRPGPFYWTAQGAEDDFFTLNFVEPAPSRSAKRWDAAEAATYFNFNLTAMDASVDFVLRAGPELVLEHNRKLIDLLFQRLPKGCVPTSPLDSAERGPYGCFTARTSEKTSELYQKLQKEHVVVAMREGKIRVSPRFVQFRAGHRPPDQRVA